MNTVVVTGVAGSLGRRVANRLAARDDVDRIVGIDVMAVEMANAKVDTTVKDLSSGSAPHSAFDGATGVVHLAWRTPDPASSNQRAFANVLDAAAAAGVSSFVHLSSATVYGAWPDNQIPLTEEAPIRPNPEFAFAVSKAETERMLAEWAEDHPGTRVVVLRPSVTVGTSEPLYEALGATQAPGSGDGHRPVQFLHIDDLADAVVIAATKGLRGVYNVAPDVGVREDEARALAGGVARVSLPRRVAQVVSAWGWSLRRRGVPAEARAYATNPWVVAADRLKSEGWSPNYSSEEALVATDARMHWDDLPPGRRQNYTLLVAGAGAVLVTGGVIAAISRLRSRSRQH